VLGARGSHATLPDASSGGLIADLDADLDHSRVRFVLVRSRFGNLNRVSGDHHRRIANDDLTGANNDIAREHDDVHHGDDHHHDDDSYGGRLMVVDAGRDRIGAV
jgi:hypothetical protein